MCVISSLHSLRDTAHFSDEEGELTNDLCTLRDWAYAQTAAFQPAPQPAPAPLSDDVSQKTWALLDELEKLRSANHEEEDWGTLNKRDDELRAALAAQGGKA